MTAITINLLAEEQLAQEARARDPVKLAVAIGLGVLTILVACSGVFSAILAQKRGELGALQSKWDKMRETDVAEGDFGRLDSIAKELVALNRSRMLIAPQLALVKDVIPPSVQLSQITFTMSVFDSGSPESGNGKHPDNPTKTQQLVLRMDGRAFGSEPELEVDRFLKLLRNDARFNAAVETIQLRSITRSVKAPEQAGQTTDAANFVIECGYKEKGAK